MAARPSWVTPIRPRLLNNRACPLLRLDLGLARSNRLRSKLPASKRAASADGSLQVVGRLRCSVPSRRSACANRMDHSTRSASSARCQCDHHVHGACSCFTWSRLVAVTLVIRQYLLVFKSQKENRYAARTGYFRPHQRSARGPQSGNERAHGPMPQRSPFPVSLRVPLNNDGPLLSRTPRSLSASRMPPSLKRNTVRQATGASSWITRWRNADRTSYLRALSAVTVTADGLWKE